MCQKKGQRHPILSPGKMQNYAIPLAHYWCITGYKCVFWEAVGGVRPSFTSGLTIKGSMLRPGSSRPF